MKYTFLLGTYTEADKPGIYQYELDGDTGALQRMQEWKGLINPSYLLRHPQGKTLYCVEEIGPEGYVSGLSGDHYSEKRFTIPSAGADPCHLSMDDTGGFLFVANYSSGSLSVFRLDEDGRPTLTDHRQHKGRGVHPTRQEGPHVHFSGMVDGILNVCDLGLDRLVRYKLDNAMGGLTDIGSPVSFPPGFGPRHFAIHEAHKGFLYVAGELSSEVAVLARKGENYVITRIVSSLPEQFTGESTAAAIKFSQDGRFLFVSNRGSDSIASFKVLADGTLSVSDFCASGGKCPRDFEIFGSWIVVVNQQTNNLAVLRFEANTGKMQAVSCQETVKSPVMVLPVQYGADPARFKHGAKPIS